MAANLRQPLLGNVLHVDASYKAQYTPQWHSETNCLKGCHFSADGSCLVTCANDNVLRIYNTPDDVYEYTGPPPGGDDDVNTAGLRDARPWQPVVTCSEAELVYDYVFHPNLDSANPATCLLFSTCRDHPVHCWDAYSGQLVTSFRNYDQYDAIAAAHALATCPRGHVLYCGMTDAIHEHHVDRPGREYRTLRTRKKGGRGCKGIVSKLTCAPSGHVLACGSYSGQFALYDVERGNHDVLFSTRLPRGITDVAFTPDATCLAVGLRADGRIYHYDMRMLDQPVHVFRRALTTNQRLQLAPTPCGRFLLSGDQTGQLLLFDLWTGTGVESPLLTHMACDTAISGAAPHPSAHVVALASGQRSIRNPADDVTDTPQTPHTTTEQLQLLQLNTSLL